MLHRLWFAVTRVRSGDRFCVLGILLLSLMLASCDFGGGGRDVSADSLTVNKATANDWQKVIHECISKVEQSDAVFYRRGHRVTGKELAREMRENLRIVLRHKSVPDPFGRNAGILLTVITTHEGYAMDGITGPPMPYEVDVNGQRMKLYDWLKQGLGLERLPGEEEGHKVLLPLYEPVVSEELLKQWEDYLDRCIQVTKEAQGCRFYVGGQWLSADQAAAVFASNRADALHGLKQPDFTHPEQKDLYTARSILVDLTSVRLKRPEEYPSRTEYVQEAHRLFREGWKTKVEHNGIQEELIDWLLREVGEPPPMPRLEKKGKGSG